MSRTHVWLAAAALVAAAGPGRAEDFTVVGWNLESGGAKPSFVAGQLRGFQKVDVWGLSEVDAGDAAGYAAACGHGEAAPFKPVLGTTGGADRLMIVYNAGKFDLVEKGELLDLRVQTGRAPLFARLKFKSTGESFVFMVNHLHRGSPAKRMEQAVGLEAWAKNQPAPAVLTGDYNFDVSVATKLGNPAFTAMTDEHVFRWVEPSPFRATHKGGSVLDFVFLSGPAKGWTAASTVVALSDDAADTAKGSDHRPVRAVIKTTAAPPPAPLGPLATPAGGRAEAPPAATPPADAAVLELEARQKKRNEILKRIAAMEDELATLRRLVKELGDE